ncbi:MAG: Crp/Fnr family transcriptional regulator [Chloroflexota bacterium]
MMIDQHLQALKDAFEQWAPLSELQWAMLSSIFKVRRADAKADVALPGDTEHELIFVGEGLLRFYFLAADGKESNKAFIAENEFAGPLASASLGLPLYYGIQAIEDTTMLYANFKDFTALYDEDFVFERLGRKLAELLLIRKELRTRSLLEKSAGERYSEFLEKHPDLVDRVPQYHLATYLGVTEVSLSRLKNARTKEAAIQ